MDIKSSISLPGQSALTNPADNLLSLKVGQTLDAKVISATVEAEKNALTLKLADKLITLQSSQPVELDPGQSLKIQVTETTPALAFRILQTSSQQKQQTTLLSLPAKSAASPPLEPETPAPARSENKNPEQSFVLKQQLLTKIIGLVGNKIQLQVLNPQASSRFQDQPAETFKQSILITIERSQLQTESTKPQKTAESFQIGQLLKLEVTKPGIAPTFKLWPIEGNGTAEKITELLKQLLPRHQSAPVLLNQLIKDLPQLIKHENLAQALKDNIIAILQNLPQKQQLLNSKGIKQAANNAGVFLEARLGQLAATSQSALTESVKLDFKAELLKLAQLLQQEVGTQAVKIHQEADLALLKNMLQKTENTIARIVLDQLISLPKDDNPKQVWHLELPFIDRKNTETVNLEIHQDKDAGRHPGSGNWSVNLTLTPPGLGTLHCAISYCDHTINTHFRSQEIQTTELIQHNLDYLKGQLEQSGLSTGHMSVQVEPLKSQAIYPTAEAKLFDDKA